MSKLVKNQSQGYGYTYASLADFHKQGIDIPKMRTVVTEYGEFVEYLDDKGEWQQGARVVVPDMKGSNEAQRYGSALTYARRFTVALCHGIATDDDVDVENAKPVKKSSSTKSRKVDFVAVRKKVKEIDDIGDLSAYWESLNMTEAQQNALRGTFKDRQREIDELE